MKITKELYLQTLEERGFTKDPTFPDIDQNQFRYVPPEEMGTGTFHFYCIDNLFSIESHELQFSKDICIRSPEPRVLSLQYFRTVSGEELRPYRQISPNTLRGYIGGRDKEYRAIYHKGIPLSSVTVSVLSDFYEYYISDKLNEADIDLYHAFSTMTGGIRHPRLVQLLREVQAYSGFGPAAKIFYEGKILDAMALMMEGARDKDGYRRSLHMTAEDEANLDDVLSYIDHHFTFSLTIEQLSEIALMRPAKLKAAFREYHGCSISEYITRKRVDFAQHLLLSTNLDIAEIAEAAGYRRQSTLSSQFAHITGFRPAEFRNLMKK